MPNWIVPTILGFFMGSAGYILYRFYFKPVTKYRRLKTMIERTLAPLLAPQAPDPPSSLKDLANGLVQCYSNDLPVWFQLLLTRRGEDPQGAAGHLMTLAKTRTPAHVHRRIRQIEKALQIKIAAPE